MDENDVRVMECDDDAISTATQSFLCATSRDSKYFSRLRFLISRFYIQTAFSGLKVFGCNNLNLKKK